MQADRSVEYFHVDLGAQKPSFYQAQLNPYGSTPCLWDCGRRIPDSMVVVQYLVDKYAPNSGIFGSTAEEMAMIRLILANFDTSVFYKLAMCRDPTKISAAKAKV